MNRAERELAVAVLGLITGADVFDGQARYNGRHAKLTLQ
jgi:hypothetical protein